MTPRRKRKRKPSAKKYFDRALMLRDKWKPWAEQHRDLLTRMQHAKVSDPRIFAEALDALPSHVGYDGQRGITHADLREFTKQKTSNLGNPNQIPHAPVGMRWTWDVIKPPKQYFYDAALAAEYQKSLDSIAAYRKEDFASHRDIVLTRSMGASRSHFLLWASGRLTETTKQLDGNVKDEAEIAPPFDFVQ